MNAVPLTFNGLSAWRASLVWTNRHATPFHYEPGQFTVRVDIESWRASCPDLESVTLDIPRAWVSDLPLWRPVSPATKNIAWRVSAHGEPQEFNQHVDVSAIAHGKVIGRIEQTATIEIQAFSQFNPTRHAFAKPNTVHAWGVISPRPDVFKRTYTLAIFRDGFFRGLYARIVFLGGSSHESPGGICTGLARAALERSFSPDGPEPTLDEVLVWHGRQMTDRVLWAAAPWFFVSRANRAFASFRRELLREGLTRRCFDIGVPSPWRRDVFSSLQRQGHTVVPYAFTQSSNDQAEVYVYDPNEPEKSQQNRAIVNFLVSENRYRYASLPGDEDALAQIIAVRQDAYRRGRTALLASMASATLIVDTAFREMLQSFRLRVVKSKWWEAMGARG